MVGFNQLERYIGRQVLNHTTLVLGVVVALIGLINFLDEVEVIGQHHYTLASAVRFTLMVLPAQLYQLFPVVMLVGTLLALGTLAASSELTAMRAGGFTLSQLMLALIKSTLLLLVAVALVGELGAPRWEQLARQARSVELGQTLHHTQAQGYWFRQQQAFVNVKRLLADGSIYGIDIFEFNSQQQLSRYIRAQRGLFTGQSWRLQQVEQIEFGADFSLQRRYHPQWLWPSSLTPQMMGLVAVRPEHMPLLELIDYIAYQRQHQLEALPYELSFWSRVFAPLSSLMMILLAVPFVMGSVRSASTGLRVVQGVLLGVAFYLINAVSQNLGLVYQLPPLLSAMVPMWVLVGVGWSLIRRLARHS